MVNIASHAGLRPKGASIPYAASKAALAHVTKLLAVSLAPDVRVTAVAPGLVDTPLTRDWVDAQALWRDRSPPAPPGRQRRHRPHSPLAHRADHITGQVPLLDGGFNLT